MKPLIVFLICFTTNSLAGVVLVRREALPQFVSGSQANAHSNAEVPLGHLPGSSSHAGAHSGVVLKKREAHPQFFSGSQASAHSSSGAYNLSPFGGFAGSSSHASAGSHTVGGAVSGSHASAGAHSGFFRRRRRNAQFFGGSKAQAHSHSGSIGFGPFSISGSSSHSSAGAHSGGLHWGK